MTCPLHKFPVSLGLVLALFPGLAAADLSCTFVRECMEDAACDSTDYDLTVTSADGAHQIDDLNGSSTGMALDAGPERRVWAWMSDFGANLLTVAPDGAARYSTHLPEAELSILYLGTCAEPG